MGMKNLRYPSVDLALALAGGILIYRQPWGFPTALLALTAVALALIAVSKMPLTWRTLIPLFAAAGFFGMWRADAAMDAANHVGRLVPVSRAALEGTVRTPIEYFPHGYRFALSAERLNGAPVTGSVQIGVQKGDAPPLPGDRVELQNISVRPITGFHNLDGFDYEQFMRDKGIAARANLRGEAAMRVTLPAGEWNLFAACEKLRRNIHSFILQNYPRNQSAAVAAMTVGVTGGITRQEWREWAVSGLVHLLSVSGLHVGFVSGGAYAVFYFMAFYLLWWLKPRWVEAGWHRKLSALLCIGAVFGFVLMTGASVPAQRAGIMAAVFFLSVIVGREGELLNSLALSAIIVLLLDPPALFSVSFILSYTAVLAIILLVARAPDKPDPLESLTPPTPLSRMGDFFLVTVKISLAVGAASAPVVMSIFNELHGGGVLANLVAIPLGAFAVPSVLAAAGLGWLWPPLGETAAWVSSLAYGGIGFVAHLFGNNPLLSFSGPAPAWWLVALVYAVYALWVFRSRLMLPGIALLCLAAAVFYWPQKRTFSEVRFIDVGQGDATLIMMRDGTNILVDGGLRFGEFDAGELAVIPELRRLGVRRLDAVIATHGDSDHVGGLFAVMNRIAVKRYMDNGEESKALDGLRAIARNKGIEYAVLRGGDTVPGLPNISVLHPSGKFAAEHAGTKNNNLALMLMLEIDGAKVLLPADNEKEAEKYLVAEGAALKADVLKVPHHGSATSSTPEFVAEVGPKIAVISVGRMNRFHMPSRKTLATLMGRPVYQTQYDGDVSLTVRDGKIKVRTFFYLSGHTP
ncbi:MAG: DNA internalization-related competence protein ComEC/Rec2 [Nitrospinae bacterium]|nr:DNA internalization-related competence protein ComEC/Rec2 [Nitrospinota bacterium]